MVLDVQEDVAFTLEDSRLTYDLGKDVGAVVFRAHLRREYLSIRLRLLDESRLVHRVQVVNSGGTITTDIAAFTQLRALDLSSMGLEGASLGISTYTAQKRIEKRITHR